MLDEGIVLLANGAILWSHELQRPGMNGVLFSGTHGESTKR